MKTSMQINVPIALNRGFPCNSDGKASACNAGEAWVQFLDREVPLEKEMAAHSSICLKNSMDRGAWQATVHGIARGRHNLELYL